MTSRKEQNSKKAVATYDAEKFKDIFGTTTSIPRTKRRMTAFKKLTIPKKKSKEECKVPVGLIDDLKKTINKKDNKGYECPFCFERLEPPYPEELTKAIEETKEKQKECEERQKKEYEAKLKKEKAEGRLYIEPFILSMEGISDYDKKKFCDVHKMELELKPLGRERGYPEDIDFDGLNIRLKRLKEDLLEIIDGRKESEYFVEIKKKVGNLGVNKARDTTELINEFQSGLVK